MIRTVTRRPTHALLMIATAVMGCNDALLGGPTPLTTELVTTAIQRPVFVTHAPGDFERIFIVDQGGVIHVLPLGSTPPSVFLDISSRILGLGEQGLLGLAFHPNYADNGLFYANYTDISGNTVIAEYAVSSDPDVADANSERIVLAIDQPFANHNGGWIGFGPSDGYLYIATGDGGSGGDPMNNAQNISVLLGKILRIDVDSAIPYGIPPDNPFVGRAGLDEIWAYGLRNPWRCAFDRVTGDFYIGDVGQDAWEELDIQPGNSTGGENWGWRCREGAHDFDFTGDCGVAGTPSESLLDPNHEYAHDQPAEIYTIVGGEVYQGCAIPGLRGTYFFAEYGHETVWSLEYTSGPVQVQDRTAELAPGGGLTLAFIASFGTDAYGEIYLCSMLGNVFKIVPDGVPDACNPAVPTMSAWGLTAIAATLLSLGTLILKRRRS